MKLIQIYDKDGSEFGLFQYIDRADIEADIRECYTNAQAAAQEIVPEDNEEESVDSIFENYLSEIDIHRVFIEEEICL
jgi:hypothetical protein